MKKTLFTALSLLALTAAFATGKLNSKGKKEKHKTEQCCDKGSCCKDKPGIKCCN